jgi:hypothetical protein
MRKILLVLAICSFFMFVSNAVVSADTLTVNLNSNNSASNTVSLTNPLGSSTPQALIGKVIAAVLGIIGSLALLMFVVGGLIWMTAAGNAEKVKKGTDILMWAAIGLAVIFVSYAAVRFVINAIGA